ncbi:cyclic nucleotide-binding-like protein, partial [Pavlovales sp. CCMP2436]
DAGNHFYIVGEGTLDAFSSSQAGDGFVCTFEEGDGFGELALMYNCPRTCTVIARSECMLWSLDRSAFRSTLVTENVRKAEMYVEFLERVPLLQTLSCRSLNCMVDALKTVSYSAGDRIITEGEPGTHFYLIESGSVEVSSVGGGRLAKRASGDYFGERAVATGEPTLATVTALEPCKCMRMERDAFIRIIGPL